MAAGWGMVTMCERPSLLKIHATSPKMLNITRRRLMDLPHIGSSS
ncbi:hypothetical protein [Paenibacillus sp. 1_12]|nr:hypothetical protein [Paenibacillus sp. 1_12]